MPALTARDLEASVTAQKYRCGGYIIDRRVQVVFDDHAQDSRVTECRDEVAPTISRKAGTGGGNLPIVVSQHGFDPYAVYISFDAQMGCMNTSPKEECGETLAACHRVGVAIGLGRASYNQGKNAKFDFAVDYIVRLLTPLECERLQGLPDGYTKIPYRGKSADECPDSPRYKALGNGWAVNCARWICQRIQKYDVNQVKGKAK